MDVSFGIVCQFLLEMQLAHVFKKMQLFLFHERILSTYVLLFLYNTYIANAEFISMLSYS